MRTKQAEVVQLVWIREAKPNHMFSEEQRASVRFLHYSGAVPCAECGRRSLHMWTMLISFEAKSMGFLVPTNGTKVHVPLTPVCGSHLLAPAAIPLKLRVKRSKASAT